MIGSIKQLAQACAKIKAQDFARNEAEFLEKVRCVEAPIRYMVVMTIAVSVPVTRFSQGRSPATIR
jgi:DNA-binding IclR family transcriptional regulator